MGAWFVSIPLLAVHAMGADSAVPSSWNVAPMTDGAYLESFDATLPVWAGRVGYNAVTNVFPSMASSSLPARSNAWFGANSKVLQLDTDGSVVTNTFAYPDSNPVSFADKAVYVDMRVRFDAVTDGPDPSLLSDSKLALFVSSDCKLVAVNSAGWTTNANTLDTNKWYQVTVRMTNGTYNVLLNDQVVFSGLGLRSAGTENALQSANFYGTGLIDELYVSHGDPAYAVAGPTAALSVTLPSAGSNPPSDEQQTRINVWLNGFAGLGSLGSMTQDQLSLAYLLNALNISGNTASAVTYNFGISAVEMTSPTTLIVTVALTADDTAKEGAINGRIQLQGKVNYDDAGWTTLPGAITPSYADFTAGKATYTYTIPEGGYRFFRPLIVP